MATYLATINVAELERVESVGPGGLPLRHYFYPDAPDVARESFDCTADLIKYFSARFGPYPFEVCGGLLSAASCDTELLRQLSFAACNTRSAGLCI